jgi:hypothetical protein
MRGKGVRKIQGNEENTEKARGAKEAREDFELVLTTKYRPF